MLILEGKKIADSKGSKFPRSNGKYLLDLENNMPIQGSNIIYLSCFQGAMLKISSFQGAHVLVLYIISILYAGCREWFYTSIYAVSRE